MRNLGRWFLVGVLWLSVINIVKAQGINSVNAPPSAPTGNSIVPHDETYYRYKLKDHNVEIIYTEDNIPFAKHVAEIESPLHKDYEAFFNWQLDETLYVGLISNRNQIANGFSTQFPNNRQINYVGGTLIVDHFANTSWLDNIIYHETAHNYQTNTKGNIVSRVAHTVFGNGYVLYPFPVSVPNLLMNSFMLEGNAVLNESWHGTGGRLYNGRLKAMTLLQAKAGNITPQQMYNNKLGFPYLGNIWYHIGGFYNYYLAETYGLRRVNSFFQNHSWYFWWPFMTNSSMYSSIGVSFETSLYDFAKSYAQTAENMVLAQGDHLLSSQTYSPMSGNSDEIFFTMNESGRRAFELVVMNKSTGKIRRERDSWPAGVGKVLKIKDDYYVQSGKNTSTIKITQGLFDRNAFILEGTENKMIQGYLSDGREVYFDVPTSYDQPQLYVGNELYTTTNSSVVIDSNDNLYYFKNKDKGKERTLYKNKTPLYTFKGFFGFVADVDSHGAVYFVANSRMGSTLYRYQDGKVKRASRADNIFDARLIDDDKVILTAVSDSDYYYVVNHLTTIEQEPFETTLFFENQPFYGQYTAQDQADHYDDLDTSNPYHSLLNMNYSGTDFFASAGEETTTYSLNVNFGDPLAQNSANLFVDRDNSKITIAGAGYENTQYLLQYSLSGYVVLDDDNSADVRDNGVIGTISIPFYTAGYYSASLSSTFFQDYSTLEREPWSAILSIGRNEIYSQSLYPNYGNNLSLYGVNEREDTIAGAQYSFDHDLPAEFYIGFGAKYSQTEADISDDTANTDTRGVKLTNSASKQSTQYDISAIVMPTLDEDIYLKSAGYVEARLAKVINASFYWFTFPVSLQRSAVFLKARHYQVEAFNQLLEKEEANEVNLGVQFDLVILNKLGPVPFTFNYYYNDNEKFTKDQSQFIISVGYTY